MSNAQQGTPSMAVFCDFENVALGVEASRYDQFDIHKVLERLLLKGSIVVKKAYCDWDRYRKFKAAMHQASFELIEIPHVRQSGKNSADIRMVVDALDLCYTKAHVDTFVIISGDSDFSPLVSKLRENNKTVIGVGVKNSTSDLLIANCDEFIYYDDLVRDQKPARPSRRKGGDKAAAEAEPKARSKAVAAGGEKAPSGDGEKATAAGGERAAAAGAERVTAAGGEKAPTAGSRRGGRRKAASATAALVVPPPAAPGPAEPPREGFDLVPEGAEPPADVVESGAGEGAGEEGREDRTQEALDLVVGTLEALAAERGEDEKIWGSMVKQTLRRRRPGFNESYYGFRSFNRLLEEARDRGLIELELDDKSGGYTVRSLA